MNVSVAQYLPLLTLQALEDHYIRKDVEIDQIADYAKCIPEDANGVIHVHIDGTKISHFTRQGERRSTICEGGDEAGLPVLEVTL